MGFWKSLISEPKYEPTKKNIGFWCCPTSDHTFLKLGIRESYTLRGQEKKPVIDGDNINVGWVIVASFKVLSEYYPWMEEVMNDVSLHWGTNIFEPNADPQTQQTALNHLTKIAFEHQWVYVVQESDDTVFLGAPQGVTFEDALYNELSGGHPQNPLNLRLSPARYAVIVDHRGNRQARESLEELLHRPMFRGRNT